MTELAHTNLPSQHPFAMYVSNLKLGESVSWYSRTASMKILRDYVWELMRLRHENVRHADNGFAQTSAETVLFVGAKSARGAILTCFPLDEIGAQRINDAISDEWAQCRQELSKGTYIGNRAEAWHAAINRGRLHENDEGSDVMDFINGATIVRLDSE